MSRNTYNYTVDRQSKNIDIILNLFYFIGCHGNSDVMYQIPVTFSSRKATLYFDNQKPFVSALFLGQSSSKFKIVLRLSLDKCLQFKLIFTLD